MTTGDASEQRHEPATEEPEPPTETRDPEDATAAETTRDPEAKRRHHRHDI